MRLRLTTCLLVALLLIMGAGPIRVRGNDLAAIRAALSANPRDVAAINALGIQQAQQGNLIEAIRTWRAGIDVDPRYVHLYNNIGSGLRRLGHTREALAWYQASLQLQPTYWTWYNLGLLREDLKQIPEAIQAHEEALRQYPGFEQAARRLSALHRIEEENATLEMAAAPRLVLPPVTPTTTQKPSPTQHRLPEPAFPTPDQPPAKPAVKPPTHPRPVSSPAKPRPEPRLPQPSDPIEVAPPPAVDEPEPSVPLRLPSDAGGQVFFTFDGGADADGLPEILAALRSHGVKSTFFLTGQWVKSYPDLGRRILEEGHEIANHSMTHPNLSSAGREKIADQLERMAGAMQQVLGKPPVPFFRFPFGAQSRASEAVVRSLGYQTVYWDIDTLDWKEPSVASILSRVRSRLKPRAVILMHCGSRNGSRAVPHLLREAIGRGYRPSRLSDAPPGVLATLPVH